MRASIILSGPLVSTQIFGQLIKEWINCQAPSYLILYVFLIKTAFGSLLFWDYSFIWVIWNKIHSSSSMLIKNPTEVIKKGFLDFPRQRTASLQSCVASSDLTSDVTINPFAHHPFLFVIFRCRMGFIKGQCNNRGQLYFIMQQSLFSETLRHPSGASALGGQFSFDNLTYWTIMFHCSINLAL